MIVLKQPHPEVFLRKGVLKICGKFIGEHPCPSLISIKLQSNFIEITLRHGCFPVNLLHIVRTPYPRNTFGWLLILIVVFILMLYWKIFALQIKLSMVLIQLLLLSNNFDFVCSNNKQIHFVKILLTILSEYFLLVIALTDLTK